MLFIHRLVSKTFLGTSDLPCVNHKDGVKTNNCAVNLEYVTQSENMQHAHDTGLCNQYRCPVTLRFSSGEEIHFSSILEASTETGLSSNSIRHRCLGNVTVENEEWKFDKF